MRLRCFILLCIALLACCSHKVLPPSDSVILSEAKDLYAALDAKLDEYAAAMEFLPAEEKSAECDFIIGMVSDSVIRNHVAEHLYNRYMNSSLMGDEAVAIYLTDNWFTPGKVSFKEPADLFAAKLFADFNRQSLLGKEAPAMTAFNPEGEPEEVLPRDGRLKVLFIYDTSCATCKFQSALLEEFFSDYKGQEFDFIAFYAGSDSAAWQLWRETHFKSLPAGSPVRVRDYWDPEVESDFQRKYGVLSTPRIILIDENGVIIGRRLDCAALRQLL